MCRHRPAPERKDPRELRSDLEERARFARVVEALSRLDDGTYGRCAVCGRDIDDERLWARPEVATCREHADTPVS